MTVNVNTNKKVPMRKEAYTTYLYWGFALLFIVLFIIGFTRF